MLDFQSDEVVKLLTCCSKARAMRGLRLRDNLGVQQSVAALMQSAKNLDFVTKGKDAFGRATHLSSQSNALNVRVQGAFALSLAAATKSLVPFMAISRGLSLASESIHYMKLVNAAGTEILGIGPTNLTEIKKTNQYTVTGNETASVTLTIPTDLAVAEPTPRSIQVGILNGGAVVGRITADVLTQTSTLSGALLVITATSPTVYTLTLAGTASGMSIKVFKALYGNANSSSAEKVTVRLQRKATSIELHTTPRSIVIEDNLINQMYLRKIQEQVGQGIENPETTFESAKELLIDMINGDLMDMLETSGCDVAPVLDMSAYDFSSFSNTKEDLVSTYISNLLARFSTRTRFAATGIVCSPYVGSILSNCKMFTADPTFQNVGLRGVFGATPVYVWRGLATDLDNPGTEPLYIVYKSTDEMLATAAYGEFLPITATKEVCNYDLPTDIAEGFFTMYDVAMIDARLCVKGSIVFPEFLFPVLASV